MSRSTFFRNYKSISYLACGFYKTIVGARVFMDSSMSTSWLAIMFINSHQSAQQLETDMALNQQLSQKLNVHNIPLTSNAVNQPWQVWCLKSASLLLHWNWHLRDAHTTSSSYLNCMTKPLHTHLKPYRPYMHLKHTCVVSYTVLFFGHTAIYNVVQKKKKRPQS